MRGSLRPFTSATRCSFGQRFRRAAAAHRPPPMQPGSRMRRRRSPGPTANGAGRRRAQPRHERVLTGRQRSALFSLPQHEADQLRHYTLSAWWIHFTQTMPLRRVRWLNGVHRARTEGMKSREPPVEPPGLANRLRRRRRDGADGVGASRRGSKRRAAGGTIPAARWNDRISTSESPARPTCPGSGRDERLDRRAAPPASGDEPDAA